MDDTKLISVIQSVGMETFVKYFEAFFDMSKSSADLVDAIMKIEGYNKNSTRTKVSAARRIIQKNCYIKALTMVANSTNTEEWVPPRAKYLLGVYT
ncbi:hypothetical protein J7H99_004776 [Vibrio parahaemolyticus]|nr:hypothetical protein [Vibrio parahaemolyticus]ELL0561845.1 hypothetical protein [Vibrio vulnificus]EGR1384219.1 hypothetical protein [Vibrio parahaemolyticus]EHH1219039.1 hypothetical protein [Vibrio parahaemolyticus]EJS4022059.1 hypothetical protein [Vibrio parahaemolyticus]